MIREAVESVLTQTYRDFELIVVDDGSTDDTEEVLQPYLPSLQFLSQPNSGVSHARNSGLAAARGDLIAFLDSDDLWLPEKLAVQVSYLRTFPGAALCHTHEIWLRRGRRVNARKRHAKAEGKAFLDLLRGSLISPSAVLLRRRVLEEAGGFDESLPACEDYALWLELSRRHDIHLIRRSLVVKRGGHPDQLSRSIWGLDRFRVRTLRKLADDPGLPPEQALEVRRILVEKCRILADGSRRRHKHDEARIWIGLAAEYTP